MLTPIQTHAASTAVRELRVAVSNFFLYTSGNNMALLSLQRFLASLEELFQTLPSVTLGESEGRLVVEGSALDDRTTGSTNMLRDLFLTHKLHSLTFLKGVDTDEIKALFTLMRPKGLPTGLSLSQALVQKSLGHIRANEKVFVALAEGERVVSGEAPAGEGGGQNMQEALEALQYFLQIFEKVKPTANKQEVARKLMDHMGTWMAGEGAGTGESGGTGGAGGAIKGDAAAWKDVMGGFLAMRDGLSSVKKPDDLKGMRDGMEELMRKLVALGEGQGVALEAGPAPVERPKLDEPAAPSAEDSVLASIQVGRMDDFWDQAKEEAADRAIGLVQDDPRHFSVLWSGLWERIASSDERTQALCLRHLNRLQWGKMPRALQLQGLQNLRTFLSETKRASLYPVGLTLAQDWVPLELSRPDWAEVLAMADLLRKSSQKTPPAFDKQNQAARVALETIFCEPILRSLFRRFLPGTPDGEGITQLFAVLGTRDAPFLFQKIEREAPGSPDWKKAAELLGVLQAGGHHVFEFYLEWPEKREHLEKFLEIFQILPLTGEIEEYFERHWNSFGPGAQAKIMELAGQQKRKGFRPFFLRLLEHPQTPQAYQALLALAALGMDEEAQAVIDSVRKYPAQGKDREKYWVRACQVLGDSREALAAKTLMEWADKYKFLENKKERGLEVRRAALEALGKMRSKEIRDFLTGLKKDIEKELASSLDKALG